MGPVDNWLPPISPPVLGEACIRDKVGMQASLISGQYKYKVVSYKITDLWSVMSIFT